MKRIPKMHLRRSGEAKPMCGKPAATNKMLIWAGAGIPAVITCERCEKIALFILYPEENNVRSNRTHLGLFDAAMCGSLEVKLVEEWTRQWQADKTTVSCQRCVMIGKRRLRGHAGKGVDLVADESRPSNLFRARAIKKGPTETLDEYFARKGKITYVPSKVYVPPRGYPIRVKSAWTTFMDDIYR